MMQIAGVRKNKIQLAEYPYQRDIENRVLLAQLSTLEVTILKEIIHHSLKISIEQLAEQLEIEIATLIPILDKLSSTQLFKRQNFTLIVDKELRKYYEAQIDKFDEDFEPNMEFLQGLLNQLPIHVLPNWYAIPRSSDNIVASIIERYFLTPKIYRQYLEELQFDDPIVPLIIKDLYQAPHFTLYTSSILKKYNLTREQLEEYLILLEYHFICCLRYQKIEDRWEEIITPFQEWLDYLNSEEASKPRLIQGSQAAEPLCSRDFGFILDMRSILSACSDQRLTDEQIPPLFLKEGRPQDYLEHLLFKLSQVEFITYHKSTIKVLDKGAFWLSKSLSEQAISLANDPLNTLRSFSQFPLYTIRSIRQIEKSLKELKEGQWVYLDEFVGGFILPLGNKDPIQIVNRGKKWKYALPTFTQEERAFIKAVISERLFEIGIIALGNHKGKASFQLTSFGRSSLH